MGQLEREVRERFLDRLDSPTWDEEDPRLDYGPAVLPCFVRELQRPDLSSEQRARLVRVIWQFRVAEALPTLALALDDPCSDVWKDALDGLVTIGGTEAQRILVAARSKTQESAECGKLEWIDEALQQVVERMDESG